MKKVLLLIVYFLGAISIPSSGIEKVVSVTTAGTLSESISEEEKYTITSLTVTGQINGVDLRLLREMAGNSYNGLVTDGNLSYLDLSGATIVAGGNYIELTEGKVYFDKEKKSYSGEYSKDPLSSQADVLGDFAFAGCNKLETIKLPANLESIGLLAFMKTSLKTIVWPTSLTTIGNSAFCDCSFTSFTLPASVQNLDGYIFIGCTSLTELNVASGNTVFDSRDNCNAIINTSTNELVFGTKTTVIPSSVTSIGQGAFDRLGLTSITIPSNITHIGINAYGWNNITSVTIPASVTSIGNGAFGNCRQLSSVTVEATTPIAIGEDVFTNRANAKLIVPAGCKASYEAADYWKEFEKIIDTEPAPTGTVIIDGIYYKLNDDYTAEVTKTPDESPKYSGAVTIPATITYGNVEYNVTSIGEYAFYECSELNSISIPNSVTTVEACAFTRCSGLTTLTIPNSVTTIKGGGFFQCSGLTSLTIPKSVTSIEHEAFSYCYGLTSLNVEAGNTKYDSRDNCNAIIETATNKLVSGTKNTVIPNSVTTIGNEAFLGCTGLTSITIPNSVTTIEDGAFHGCYALVSIKIPKSVTTIGILPFVDCHNLNSLNVEAGNTKYDSRDNCNAVIETSTNAIVAGCPATTIPASVTEIGSYGLCGLDNCTIHLHSDIDKIGDYAFWNCNGLILDVEKTTPLTINENVFQGLINSTLRVPAGCKAAYAAATGWKNFGTILEGNEGSTFTVKTTEGWDMTFAVLDEAKKTCQVGYLDGSWNKTAVNTESVEGSVTIPETVEGYTVVKIGKYAFNNTVKMTSVTIPETVTSIEEYAFWNCNGLTSFELPANVTYLGKGALVSFRSVTSLKVAEGNTVYDSRGDCNAIIETATNKLLFGSKITTIPADVPEIGEYAFHNLVDYTLTIPSTVTKIDDNAFGWGVHLTLEVEHTTPLDIQETVFNDLSNSTLRVPAGCKAAYAAATGWSLFSNILEGNEGSAFTAKTTEGWDMTFAVLDETKKTCQVGYLDGNYGKTAVDNYTVSGPVTIPEKVNNYTVVKIGKYALHDTEKMTSVTIPATVTSIDEKAFDFCISLASLELPAGVTTIGDYAFDSCSGLTSVTIPNTVTSIGFCAFENTGLTSVAIPSSVISLGWQAFSNCTKLESVRILDGVKSIEGFAFLGCSALTSVTVEAETPLTITEGVFSNKANATLYVPVGSKTAYEAADYWKEFKEIIEVKTVHVETAGTLSEKITEEEKLTIKYLTITGNLNGTDFRLIREMAGNDYQGKPTNGSLKILDLSGANIVAGGEKYLDTENLTSSTGSTGGAHHCETADNVLGDHLFAGCDKLEEVILPNSITTIHGPLFWHCQNLKSIEIPENVSSMGLLVNGSHNISSITVAEGNQTYNSPAGSNAIMQGTKLLLGCKNTQIPAGTTVIGEFAFIYCEGLGEFTVPEGVTTIETSAFEGSDLTSIHLPSTLTTIGINAFSWCNNLTSFTLPKTVTSIGNSDFSIFRGSRLTELNVESGNPNYDSRTDCNAIIEKASNKLVCSSLNTVIPETVSSIGSDAFYESQLQSITIPNSVTSIGERAFMYGKLTSITIPSSVVTIGNKAFYDCYNLTSVTVEATTPIAIGEDVFTDRENKTLYVPVGSKAVYKAANYWKDFGEIIEVGTESLYADNVSAYKGTQAVLPILLNNEQTIAGIQFDLQLPSGFSVAKSGNDYLASLTSRASGLSVSISELTSGDYRFVVVSSEGNKLTGTEGEVMNVTINVPADATIGDNTITMNNVVLTAVVSGENTSLYPANPTSVLTVLDYTLGDVNDDSNINVVDVAAIAAHVAGQTPTGFIKIAADVNTDGVVNSADVTAEVTNALQAASVGTGTSAGQLLNASDFVAYKGKNVTLPITLTNSQAISGFQFDLQLPEGVSIAQDGITLADRANGLTFNTSALTTTTTRFVVVATNGGTMAAGEGEVMNLTLTVAANAVSGTVNLNNTVLAVKSDNTLSAVYTTDVEASMTVRSFTLGDVNDDNHINVTDVVCVVDYILGKTPSNFIRFAADINDDDEVNVTDVMGLVDIILSAQGLAATRGFVDEKVDEFDGLDLNGNDGQLSLSVKDAGNYVASQMEVILSEGQTLDGITLNDAFKQTHQLIFARSGQSTYTVLVFSLGNENYPQNDDELLKLNVSGGSGEIMVHEAIMVTRQQEQKRMAPVSSFKVETGNGLMDIYSLDGRLIKSQVKDTKGLSKGVYIINGKKVMVQ